jgi:acylphosphatase
VFFRKFTVAKAQALHLVGWCANTQRGTVVGECQGQPQALEEMKVSNARHLLVCCARCPFLCSMTVTAHLALQHLEHAAAALHCSQIRHLNHQSRVMQVVIHLQVALARQQLYAPSYLCSEQQFLPQCNTCACCCSHLAAVYYPRSG